ncbi:T9SS type A sorting domain-containing protein [Chitinophagaceae bacterium 26-R-25]|nr:T9SS type A sorting domain-containing protein [Chitinophagaceae bacterium 26-R-25]
MRKLYILLLCLLTTLHSSTLLAANITWTGSTGGGWSDPSNWSTATVPGAGDNVTFNSSVTVTMDDLSIDVASLKVTGNSNVIFTSAGITDFTVSAATNALAIDNGSSLKTFTSGIGDNGLHVILETGSSGVVNGTFTMEANIDPYPGWGSSLTMNTGSTLAVNGTLTMNPHAGIIESTTSSLFFNTGANYIHNMDAGKIPTATWDATSTLQLTGLVYNVPDFGSAALSLGNVIINTPNVSNLFQPQFSLNLPTSTTIKGNFSIVNFHNLPLVLLTNVGTDVSVTVNKNFILSTNSTVHLGFANFSSETNNYTLQINGDYVQSNGSFSIQGDDFVTGITTLGIGGNFNQTGGTFGAASGATSASDNLFVVEMNGNAAQTFSSITGTIDNADSMVALRINNTSGGVSLSTPLRVGRLDLQSGVLTTTVSNSLTVNSTNNTQGVTNGSSGSYVAGPVTRRTNSTSAYLFPTGQNGFYRPIEIIPNSAAPSTYTATYFRAANGSPVANPLTKIANTGYWAVGRISGSDAVVQLSLSGEAVPGSAANSVLVVAGYNGTQWTSLLGANGTSISPGNAVNGTAKSDIQSTFNLFTFGVVGGDPLPILLLEFTATKSGSSANLKWKVDPVDIPRTVEILKSNNGRDFAKVGTVAGVDNVTTYSYTDPLSEGNNYYRLRMIDKDGSVVYSKVAAIINQANGFAITGFAPTLVTRSVKLNVSAGSGGTMDLYITDMSGKIWRKLGVQLSTGNNEQQIDLSDLSAGVYQVFGYMNGEKTGVIRFVKQ